MKWMWKNTGSQSPYPAIQNLPEPEIQRSLALKKLTGKLQNEKRYNILDLGSSVSQNIDFCSAFCQKLYIEDFYCTLSSFDFLSPEDGLSLDIVYQYLLPYKAETQFDIILAWDLFNYLDELEFRELMVHLGRFCRTNTLLFAFISTCKSIPERPAKYSIVDTETITSQKLSNIIRPCPQYQETQLNKLMPEYQVLNSFLLRNGFKEYLFSFMPKDHVKRHFLK